MKNLNYCTGLTAMLIILFDISFLAGQIVPDQQWLILDSHGKSGWDDIRYMNEYDTGTEIQNTFTLNGINHPARTGNSREKNDIFIIYSDGRYFNSRCANDAQYNQTYDPFYPRPVFTPFTSHEINCPTGAVVKQLYLTNIYEDDDPPRGVQAINGPAIIPRHDAFQFEYTQPQSNLSANHDVVKESDITLIVPRDKAHPMDKLEFNQIQFLSGGAVVQGIYFKVSNIFNNNTKFCNIEATDNGDGTITFGNNNSNQAFIYINLRPTNLLPTRFNTIPDSNSRAIFTLLNYDKYRNLKNTTVLNENILASHDPNQIELVRICKNGGDQKAFYHLEFFNDGTLTADQLKAELVLPSFLDIKCINVIKWTAGGETTSGQITYIIPQENPGLEIPTPFSEDPEIIVIFKFDNTATIQPWQEKYPKKSIASIDFCVKIRNDLSSAPEGRDFEMTDAFTYLSGERYQINSQIIPANPYSYDQRDYMNRPSAVKNCKCKCKKK
ncbi:MAG: hypothetical protein ABIQ02_07195 [Saprospiraceae bacterium]